jgi:hypothetical protein
MTNEELVAKGWRQTQDGWFDTSRPDQRRPHCTAVAIRIQGQKERFAAGLPVFEMCRCPAGYGYLIQRYTDRISKAEVVFRHESEEVALRALKAVDENPAALVEIDGRTVNVVGYETTEYFPYLIVCQEKHGTTYYHVPTISHLHKAALHILAERAEEIIESDQITVTEPELTKEQVAMLPSGSIKEEALLQWAQFEDHLRLKRRAEAEVQTIRGALSNKDGMAAYRVLKDRGSSEYEGFRLEQMTEVPD